MRFENFEVGPVGDTLGEPLLNDPFGSLKVIKSSGDDDAFFNVKRADGI